MDSITQFLLGASVGVAGYHKKIGRSAKWWGGIGGTIPDLDVFLCRGPFDHFTMHRGYSHSLVGTITGGYLIGLVVWKVLTQLKNVNIISHLHGQKKDWCWLFILTMVTHPLLDVFTSYGTQLMLPFNNTRYALNAVGIIDPFYSIWLLLALIVGSFNQKHCGRIAYGALVISTAYLSYGYYLNNQSVLLAHHDLKRHHITVDRVVSHPTLFQPFIRKIVAITQDTALLGTIRTGVYPKIYGWNSLKLMHSSRITQLKKTAIGQTFYWFADNQVLTQEYCVDQLWRVRLLDLRYSDFRNPTKMMWGIECDFDRQKAVSDIRYYRHQPAASLRGAKQYFYYGFDVVAQLWTQAFSSQ